MAGHDGVGACRAICVAPDRLHEIWPSVRRLIERAMRRGGISEFADVERALHVGSALLWLAWDGAHIRAAAVTELSSVDGERFCTITACGGADRAQWLPLIAELEDYARREGCAAMRIFGRIGWVRVLPDYRVSRVLLEKTLD